MEQSQDTSSTSSTKWARMVSNVFYPPLVLAVFTFFVLSVEPIPADRFLLYASAYLVLFVVIPMTYVVIGVRAGRITDVHMPKRSERTIPSVIGIVMTAILWVLLRQWQAPDAMMRYATFTLVVGILLATITFFWQISGHMATIAAIVVIVANLSGLPYAIALSVLIPVVGLARLKLKRHTPLQVLAGGFLGAITAYVVFFIL